MVYTAGLLRRRRQRIYDHRERVFGRLEGFLKCGRIDLFRSENRSRFGVFFFGFISVVLQYIRAI